MNIESVAYKYELDQLEKSILKYLYANSDTLKKIGIRKVASENFTSTTTIYKLAKKMKFDGYSDMIHHLSNDKDNRHPQQLSLQEEHLDAYVEQLKSPFYSLLHEYKEKQIMVIGFGLSQHIANFMNESLIIRGYRSLANVHLQLIEANYNQDVLLIVISESGETPRLAHITQTAKDNGFQVIGFVGNKQSPIAHLSDLPIAISTYNQFNGISQEPNLFFSKILYIFEKLTSKSISKV